MNNRSRKLLDLAHRLNECTNCDAWASEGLEPAHENSISAGKGFGIKSQDNRHAALCNRCHRWLDQGSGPDPSGVYTGTKDEKRQMWIRAHLRTYDEYFRRGFLKVAA